MSPTPRTLLIDDQGRVMQRAGGDLATPDCPECCGGSTCARAFLCEETPDYVLRVEAIMDRLESQIEWRSM